MYEYAVVNLKGCLIRRSIESDGRAAGAELHRISTVRQRPCSRPPRSCKKANKQKPCGDASTSNYTFIWAMGGENQAFDDMDNLKPAEMR